jgi:hypothetical protein
VVHWIGGVTWVTRVILPQMRGRPAADGIATSERIEGHFGWQAKLWSPAAGLSGLWTLWLTAGRALVLPVSYWWPHRVKLTLTALGWRGRCRGRKGGPLSPPRWR